MTKQKINCPPEMTEREYCMLLGYYRIWDAGKKRFVYEK